MASEQSYERERATDFLDSLSRLWIATDYPEWRDLSLYSDDELMAILGQWIHVRRAVDGMFDAIRTARPELPGWDPIQGEKPIDQD